MLTLLTLIPEPKSISIFWGKGGQPAAALVKMATSVVSFGVCLCYIFSRVCFLLPRNVIPRCIRLKFEWTAAAEVNIAGQLSLQGLGFREKKVAQDWHVLLVFEKRWFIPRKWSNLFTGEQWQLMVAILLSFNFPNTKHFRRLKMASWLLTV